MKKKNETIYRSVRKMLLPVLLIAFIASLLAPPLYAEDLLLNSEHRMQLITPNQILRHRITLDSPGVLQLHVSSDTEVGSGVYWRLWITDLQLRVFADLDITGEEGDISSPRLRLPPGQYLMNLATADIFSNSELAIHLEFTDESDLLTEREVNDTPQTANSLEVNRVIIGNSYSREDIDVYRMEIVQQGSLAIQLDSSRVHSGFHWQLMIQKEAEDAIHLGLDESGHRSVSVDVTPGVYFLHVMPMDDNWHDVDYVLTTRFQLQQEDPSQSEGPFLLEGGQFLQLPGGLLGDEPQILVYEHVHSAMNETIMVLMAYTDSEVPLILRVSIVASSDETIIMDRVISISSQRYSYLLHDMSPGEYTISIEDFSQEMQAGVTSHIGLFSPFDLDTLVELQIGNREFSINGVRRELDPGFDTVPLIIDSRTMIPLRSLVEALGGSISWHPEDEMVGVSLNGRMLSLWIGGDTALVDHEEVYLPVVPMLIGGRTMLPLRFVSEALGCFVEWIADSETILIRN